MFIIRPKSILKYCFLLPFLILASCKKELKAPIMDTIFAEKAAWFSEEVNYENIEAYHAKFISTYDSCINTTQYDNAKVLLYNFGWLAETLYKKDTLFFVKAIEFVNQSHNVKKDTFLLKINHYLARIYLENNNISKTQFYLEKVFDLNKDLQLTPIYIKAKQYMGVCYTQQSQPKKAIEIFTELIPLAEKSNSLKQLASLYYSLSGSYDLLYAYTKSYEAKEKAAQYFLQAKETTPYFAQLCYNVATNFDNLHDTVNTVKVIDSICKEFNSLENPKEIDFVGINEIKSLKYYLTQQYDSAFYYNDQNIALHKDIKFYLFYDEIFDAKIYFAKNKKLKDKAKMVEVLHELISNEELNSSIDISNILYENALNEKNYKEALYYKNKEISLKDTLLFQNQQGQLFEFEEKYESEKKEKKIAQQQTTLTNNKLIIGTLLSALAIAALLILVYFFRKKKLESQAEIKRQEQFTNDLLLNTEEERKRIATELHDGVNHELLTLKNKLSTGSKIDEKHIENVIQEVRNVSRDLYPAMFDNIGLAASIEALCERLSEAGLFTTCEINYQTKLSKRNELQLYRIIQEVLNNTLKHAKADAAKVTIDTKGDDLWVEIKDNGIGFDADAKMKDSKSFGIQSVYQRAKAMGGTSNIESNDKGTKLILITPLH